MPKTLLESDFLTIDLRSFYSGASAQDEAEEQSSEDATQQPNADEVEQKLLDITKDPALVKKLLNLGEPFKTACKKLGYKVKQENGSNPILAFVLQSYVQERLITPGLLNRNTFKAIYNAVAKNLVADSEFFSTNNYNIIYCQDLYRKTASEMESYLKEQSQILTTSASSYSSKVQTANKKAFIYISGLYRENTNQEELDIVKRAKLINKAETSAKAVTDGDAKLNDLELVKQVAGKGTPTTEISASAQNTLIKNLKRLGVGFKSAVFAALLSLSLNTNSAKVKSAMSDSVFSNKNDAEVISALQKISASDLMPKGQIQASDAEALAAKLLTALKQDQQKTKQA